MNTKWMEAWKHAVVAGALAIGLVLSGSRATGQTWTGGGVNVNWSTGANWGGTAPTSTLTTDLIFAGTTNVGTSGTPLNQNIATPMLIRSLAFSNTAGQFFLGGGNLGINTTPVTVTQNSSNAQSIANTFLKGSDNLTQTLTLTGNGAGLVTLSGALDRINGARDIAVLKNGTSTYLLSGSASDYTGGVQINGGTLAVGHANALGASGTISFGGGTLRYSGITTDFSSRFSAAASQAYSIDTNGQTVTFAGNLTSSGGALTKLGAGILILSGANTYSGGTAITTGTVRANSADALGSTGTISFGGGTLQYSAANTTDYSARLSTVASQAYSIDTNAQNVTFATGLTSSGGSLTKIGTGILTLNGSNTYGGNSQINAGTLQLGSTNRIADGSKLALNGGTFNSNGFSDDVGTLQLLDNSTIDLGSGASILQFDASSAQAWTAGKTLTILNWNGMVNGLGVDRLFVGTAFGDLLGSQLAQIQFVNPAGFAPGTYGAQQLSSGQVVAPEPAGLALIGLGATGLLARRRRKS